MPAIINVKASLGAILIGCFIAISYVAHPYLLLSIPNPGLLLRSLSGIVAFQACIYFRLYPNDRPVNKAMVRHRRL
jgi:hypothetical protein